MNWDTISGDWRTYRGKIQENWGRLTDDDMDVIAGKQEQLVGRVQKAYGIAKEDAERQVRDFCSKCECSDTG